MISSIPIRHIGLCATCCLLFAAVALGQNAPVPAWDVAPIYAANTTKKIYIVTIAHPKRRHSCMMRSIDTTGIVCEHHGHIRNYKAEDVAAIIEPGEHSHWYIYSIGFLAASGLTAWGTAVVASICLPCAIVPGLAAFALFWMAPAMAMAADGDSSDSLLYIAPGQVLKIKLH